MSFLSEQEINPEQLEVIKEFKKLAKSFDTFNYKTVSKNIVELMISNSNLRKIPESINKLPYLKNLILVVGLLSELPKTITELQNLETLMLIQQKFAIFPEEIIQLHSLKELNIGNNKLEHIPDSISNLKKLEILNLSWNQNLKNIPESIAKLKNLKKLAIKGCYNVSIPEVILSREGLEITGLKELKKKEFQKIWIDLLLEDGSAPSVNKYEFNKEKNLIIDADELVIQDNKIIIEFNYPLSRKVLFEFNQKKGFTRLDIYKCIYIGYRCIYNLDKINFDDVKEINGITVKLLTEGYYEIWGHQIGQLFIESITYKPYKKTLHLSIGS